MFLPPFAAITSKQILNNNKRHKTWRRPKPLVRILTAEPLTEIRARQFG